MGKKEKWVATHKSAIEKLYDEVGSSSYKVFSVQDFPDGVVAPKLAEKASGFAVATSGSATEGRDWIAIVPLRVDTSGSAASGSPQRFVHDQDPITFYLSGSTPSVSGSVSFHSNFDGRTEDVEPQGEPRTIEQAVADLRANFNAVSGSFEDANSSLRNALQFGVEQFRRMEQSLEARLVPTFSDE